MAFLDKILDSFTGKGKLLIFSVILFIIGCILGYYIFWENPELVFSNIQNLMGNIIEIGKSMQNKSKLYVALLIFKNNIRAVLIMMFGGIIFGVVPLLSIFFNGFIMGIVMALSLSQGKSIQFLLAGMLPHGILELPVVILAGSFGLKIGLDLIFSGSNKKRAELFKENILKCVISLVVFVPALFVAASIEAIVTPYVIKFFD